jgi:hypothetical protein
MSGVITRSQNVWLAEVVDENNVCHLYLLSRACLTSICIQRKKSELLVALTGTVELVKQIATLRPQFREKGSCFLLSTLPLYFEVWWSITTHLIHELA